MKIRFLGLVLLLITNIAFSQILKPAKWSYSLSKSEVKEGSTIELIFHCNLDDEWYLYSTDFDPKLDAPHATFTFEPDPSYELVGKLKTVGSKEKFDEIWGGNIKYFTKTAEFRQTVKILKSNPVLKGTIDGQVCSNTNGKCIRVDEEFTFNGLKVLTADIPLKDKAGSDKGKEDHDVKDENKAKIADSKEKSVSNKKISNDNKGNYVFSSRLTELEKQKETLIKKDAQGKDETIEYLKAYLRKNRGKKK